MAGPMEENSLAFFPPSGFLWSGLRPRCICPSCFLLFLSLSVQKALTAYLSARAPAGLHRLSHSFQPMQWHHSHLLQEGPLRSQGPPTLQQLKGPAFFCWRSGFASAMQLAMACSTGNWKTKTKISYFDWLLLKRFCFPCQDPPEHKKRKSRVCLKSKPRLNPKQKPKPNQKHKSKPNVLLYS